MEVLTLPTPLPHLKRVEGPLIWEGEAKAPTSPSGQGWVGMSADTACQRIAQQPANMAPIWRRGHQGIKSLSP